VTNHRYRSCSEGGYVREKGGRTKGEKTSMNEKGPKHARPNPESGSDQGGFKEEKGTKGNGTRGVRQMDKRKDRGEVKNEKGPEAWEKLERGTWGGEKFAARAANLVRKGGVWGKKRSKKIRGGTRKKGRGKEVNTATNTMGTV